MPDRSDEKTIREEVCTDKELQALALRDNGWSTRRIALYLGISTTSVRQRIQNANRKIAWKAREHADTQNAG